MLLAGKINNPMNNSSRCHLIENPICEDVTFLKKPSFVDKTRPVKILFVWYYAAGKTVKPDLRVSFFGLSTFYHIISNAALMEEDEETSEQVKQISEPREVPRECVMPTHSLYD